MIFENCIKMIPWSTDSKFGMIYDRCSAEVVVTPPEDDTTVPMESTTIEPETDPEGSGDNDVWV